MPDDFVNRVPQEIIIFDVVPVSFDSGFVEALFQQAGCGNGFGLIDAIGNAFEVTQSAPVGTRGRVIDIGQQ